MAKPPSSTENATTEKPTHPASPNTTPSKPTPKTRKTEPSHDKHHPNHKNRSTPRTPGVRREPQRTPGTCPYGENRSTKKPKYIENPAYGGNQPYDKHHNQRREPKYVENQPYGENPRQRREPAVRRAPQPTPRTEVRREPAYGGNPRERREPGVRRAPQQKKGPRGGFRGVVPPDQHGGLPAKSAEGRRAARADSWARRDLNPHVLSDTRT
jgi:hypothetical protein